MKKRMQHLASLLGAFAVIFGLSIALGGCNTTEGVGRDIEALGDGIENAAN